MSEAGAGVEPPRRMREGAHASLRAARIVTIVVDCTEADSEERCSQFEQISVYLTCTDMTVRLGKGDSFVSVEFPNPPKVH